MGISARLSVSMICSETEGYASGYIWRYGNDKTNLSNVPDRVKKKIASEKFHSTPVSTVVGLIGSGNHDAVKTDAEEFVQKAQVYLNGPSK